MQVWTDLSDTATGIPYCTDRCHCDPDVTSLINEYTMALGNPFIFKLWKETKREFCPFDQYRHSCLNNISTNKITLKIIEVILNHLKRYTPSEGKDRLSKLKHLYKDKHIYTQISRQTWLWYCFRILMTYSWVIIYLYIQSEYLYFSHRTQKCWRHVHLSQIIKWLTLII